MRYHFLSLFPRLTLPYRRISFVKGTKHNRFGYFHRLKIVCLRRWTQSKLAVTSVTWAWRAKVLLFVSKKILKLLSCRILVYSLLFFFCYQSWYLLSSCLEGKSGIQDIRWVKKDNRFWPSTFCLSALLCNGRQFWHRAMPCDYAHRKGSTRIDRCARRK